MSHAPLAPTPRRARHESLDVLRGVAVLGIFMVNIQTFAMSPLGYANPTLEADFGPEGQAIWAMVVALFQVKFITLFSTMFGAGVLLMSGEGQDPARTALHVRRMTWLLVIGLVHAYGFWYGDILVPYAVAGLLLTGARGWSVRRLLIWGLALCLLTSLMIFAANSAASLLPEDEYAALVAEAWAPPPDVVAERQELFRQAWSARFVALAGVATDHEVEQIVYYMPRFVGLMMIGMALVKTGFLIGRWPTARYALVAALAPLGAWGSWIVAQKQIAAGFDFAVVAPMHGLLQLVSLPQALGYAALVMLACKIPEIGWARAPFAAVGRMALTCYLACTALGWLVFYGPPGLGLIGRVTRLGQVEIVAWTWLVLLILAPLWLRFFAYGPCEWAWRSLTYGRPQPWLARA
jgi:uncharacterized protein